MRGRMAGMAQSRFDWYEKVRVTSAKHPIHGKLGAILGKAQSEDGQWSYGVFIYDENCVWSCGEDELTTTGQFDQRDKFYSE
jgi:immunity protein 31 of polymorphic toxin system